MSYATYIGKNLNTSTYNFIKKNIGPNFEFG